MLRPGVKTNAMSSVGRNSNPPWKPLLLWLIVLFLPHWPCLGRTLWVTPCHNQTTLIFRVEKWIQDCHPRHTFKRNLEERGPIPIRNHSSSITRSYATKQIVHMTHTHTLSFRPRITNAKLGMPLTKAPYIPYRTLCFHSHPLEPPLSLAFLWGSALGPLHKVMWGIVIMKCELQGYIEFVNNSISIIDGAHEIHSW